MLKAHATWLIVEKVALLGGPNTLTVHEVSMTTHISTRPASTLERDAIADFVTLHVGRYAEGRSVRAVQHAASIFGAYATWIHRTGATSLDERALTAQLIEHYIASVRVQRVAPSTAERERKLLRAIAGTPAGVERRAVSTTVPSVAPYSADELGRLRTWADLQPASHRVACTAVVTLGAACGLTRSEVANARRQDIFTDRDGLPSVRRGHSCPYCPGRARVGQGVRAAVRVGQ